MNSRLGSAAYKAFCAGLGHSILSSICLILVVSACSSPYTPSSTSRTGEAEHLNDIILEQANLREKIEAENARLRLENAELRTNSVSQKALQINDYLIENKTVLLRDLQDQLSTSREAIFAAVGGTGNLLDFKVEDIFVYKGEVVATMLFLWSNPDQTGGIGRVALAWDPAKDFAPDGCSMIGQQLVSAQELANLNSRSRGNAEAELRGQQIEETRTSQIQSESWVSPESKNVMLQTAVKVGGTAVGAFLLHAIDAYFNTDTSPSNIPGSPSQ